MQDNKLKPIGDLIIPTCFPPLMLSYFAAVHNLCLQEGTCAVKCRFSLIFALQAPWPREAPFGALT